MQEEIDMISNKEIVLKEFLVGHAYQSEFDTLRLVKKLKGKFEECFVINTCQRLVICAYVEKETDFNKVIDVLDIGTPHQVRLNTFDSTNFFFQLASGLKSKVLGEHEIQGQLVKWKELCSEHQLIGPVLDELIRQAIHCGKLVRTNTKISSYNVSYASLGTRIIEDHLEHFNHHYLLIGTGTLASNMVKILAKKGIKSLRVASHDLVRARKFTEDHIGVPMLIEDISNVLSEVDVIIGGTHGEVIFSHKYQEGEYCPRHIYTNKDFSQLIIDFGAPANFPSMSNSSNYFDMDDLFRLSKGNQLERLKYVGQAKEIILSEVEKYISVFNQRKVGGILGGYWEDLNAVKDEELEWLFPKFDNMTEHQKDLIMKFSHRIIRRIARTPIEKIRSLAQDLEQNKNQISAFVEILTQKNNQNEQL